MLKRTTVAAAALAALSLAALAACQDFFTSSWAGSLARDAYAVPADLPVADAVDLLAQSNGDPVLAAALVTPLYNAADAATPGTDAYDEAALALVDAVLASSEVGSSLVDAMLAIPSNYDELTVPEQEAAMDAALDAVLSIGLSPLEVTSLAMIATDPPAGMEAEAAYAAAVALLAQAMEDVGVTDPTGDLSAYQAALDANPAYILAFDFIDLGVALEGGTPSTLGDLLSGFSSGFTDPTP